MGWLILLMAVVVVVLSVTVVTRNLPLRQVEVTASTALEQEAREFLRRGRVRRRRRVPCLASGP